MLPGAGENINEHYKTILENSYDAIIYTDDKGRITFCNHPLEELTGIPSDELLGKHLWDVQYRMSPGQLGSDEDLAELKRRLQEFLKSGTAAWEREAVEMHYRHPDGRLLTFEWHIFAVRTAEGYSLASVMRDITGRKTVEDALRESEEKFRSVVEQASEGILILDENQRIVEWNSSLEVLSGISRDEVLDHPVDEIADRMVDQVPEGDSERSSLVRQTLMELAEEANLNPSSVVEGRIVHPDGEERHLFLQVFPIQVASRKLTGCIVRDISQQKRDEHNLKRYTFQLETLRQIGLELSGELSIESLAWMIAPRAIELLGGSAMALYLHSPIDDVLELAICLGDSQPPIEQAVRRGQGLAGFVWERGEPVLLDDYHTGHTGELMVSKSVWGKVAGSPIVYAGEFMGVLFVFSERPFVSNDLKLMGLFASHAGAAIRNARMHSQLHELAIRDPMTGIFNRRHFFELADSVFEQSRRYNRPFSAVVFDADHYKEVNDTYGHLVGDEVLKQITARCSAVIRQADIFGRYGGEEFVIVMPETGLTGALKMAERLRAAVAESPYHTEKGDVPATISLGVARSKRSTATLLELLSDADAALYRAKDAGRNRVHD
jgi:diguanylate cyclase (GGDEF)-like protein/PAS domain S-box-containing protein